jgi:hypothetical protein
MSKPCKAYLIDPLAQSVTEVEWDGNYKSIYASLSDKYGEVNTFTAVEIGNGDTIFVDDESLLHDEKCSDKDNFFMYRGYSQPLCGRGLVLGTDDWGESIAPVTSLSDFKPKVTFVSADYIGQAPFEDVTDSSHWMGKGVPIVGSRCVFGEVKGREGK